MKARDVDWEAERIRQYSRRLYTGLNQLPGGFIWVVRPCTFWEKVRDLFASSYILALRNEEGVEIQKGYLIDDSRISIEMGADDILEKMATKQHFNNSPSGSMGYIKE